jgi:aromatic-L-amino-acid decarboxylase
MRLAGELAARIDRDARLELVTVPRLSLVCFAHVDGDAATEHLLGSLNATRRVHLTHTRVGDRFTIRVAVGSTWTDQARVDELWSLVDQLA